MYLVGGKLSVADVQLFECTLMLEEKFPGILGDFRNIKVNVTQAILLFLYKISAITCACILVSLQSFQGRMTTIPAIKKFMEPGSKRKPQPDENYVKTIYKVFNINKF